MLTRLKIDGFKNLVEVDVRFGAFTCIAGANGVGKSNLFDAIRFLSALADRPLLEAAMTVRDEEGRNGDVRGLFTRWGKRHRDRMSFEAEMVVPPSGIDDLGQPADASITFLRYRLELGYREDDSLRSVVRLAVEREELEHVKVTEAYSHLWFPHVPKWRESVVSGRRTSKLISTEEHEGEARIVRHQDGRAGRPFPHPAERLPRTVLSTANASEGPTALLARREMQSWRLVQLEPSALRRPDPFTAPARLDLDGSHLPATLYRLALSESEGGAEAVYARVANRLAALIGDVRRVRVERDDRRELLALEVEDRSHTRHPARALSDGTLRFLALAVLELDPLEGGVLCLEEPENGIHPARIPAMLDLLQEIAVDVRAPVNSDNPLRQVIVNTHSPAVVQQVPEDSLVVAEPIERVSEGERITAVAFGALPETWRVNPGEGRLERQPDARPAPIAPLGRLLAYLNPVPSFEAGGDGAGPTRRGRVIDRADVKQTVLPFPDAS